MFAGRCAPSFVASELSAYAVLAGPARSSPPGLNDSSLSGPTPGSPGPIVLLTAVPAVTLLADPLMPPITANTFVRDCSRSPKVTYRGHAAHHGIQD
jgi:hypothetical protein